MVELIDGQGNLFGRVNVIDALVVGLVLAVAVAGAALVLGGGGDQPAGANQTVVVVVDFQSHPVEPYVADAVPEGSVGTTDINRIESKSVSPTDVVTQNDSGALSVRQHPINRTVTLRVGLYVTRDGAEYLYGGMPLEVGTRLTLDVGPTTISGRVTAVDSDAS